MDLNRDIDFIGIGAPKCGSTWTANCLKEAPELLFSGNENWKEIAYFNKRLIAQDFLSYKVIEYNYRNNKGIDWYLKQFPDYEEGKLRGEFSTEYLFDKEAPYMIKKFFPNIKIIANLRYPPDFLYSLYWEQQTSLYSCANISFEKLLLKEKNYKNIGLYYDYLKIYYDLFPEKNIHVILFDDIKSNPEFVIEQLYSFLGVRKDFIPQTLKGKVVPTRVPRSKIIHSMTSKLSRIVQKIIPMPAEQYHELVDILLIAKIYDKINRKYRQEKDKYPPMQPKEADHLKKFYREDIQKLEKLIHRDLSSWYE